MRDDNVWALASRLEDACERAIDVRDMPSLEAEWMLIGWLTLRLMPLGYRVLPLPGGEGVVALHREARTLHTTCASVLGAWVVCAEHEAAQRDGQRDGQRGGAGG